MMNRMMAKQCRVTVVNEVLHTSISISQTQGSRHALHATMNKHGPIEIHEGGIREAIGQMVSLNGHALCRPIGEIS